MSNYQPKPGSGSIFKNDRKEKESQPDYRGEILTPEGQALEISLWVKEGKKGKFFSASVKPKRERQEGNTIETGPVGGSDLPF